jgi:hypothetical protein
MGEWWQPAILEVGRLESWENYLYPTLRMSEGTREHKQLLADMTALESAPGSLGTLSRCTLPMLGVLHALQHTIASLGTVRATDRIFAPDNDQHDAV